MSALNEQQFGRAMEIINSSEGAIHGAEAKEVFRAANIRPWRLGQGGTAFDRPAASGVGEQRSTLPHHETVHTSQTHLHAPTLRKYIAGEVPEFDEDYASEDRPSDVRYHPEVGMTERGNRWMLEGHHRLVASRLRGDYSSDIWHTDIERSSVLPNERPRER